MQIVFITGLPGSGKSSAAKQLQNIAQREGKKIRFMNDYPIMIDWVNNHSKDDSKVRWESKEGTDQKDWLIVPEAYQELSLHVVDVLISQILDEPDADIIAIECARGAGPKDVEGEYGIWSGTDRYGTHLFEKMLKTLVGEHPKTGSIFEFINFEIQGDVYELRRRVFDRWQNVEGAPPPFVLEKYIGPEGQVQSATNEAALYAGRFKINEIIRNRGIDERTLRQFEDELARIFLHAFFTEGDEIFHDPEVAPRHPNVERL